MLFRVKQSEKNPEDEGTMISRNIRLIHPTTSDHIPEDLKLPHQELTILLPLCSCSYYVNDLVTLCHDQDGRFSLSMFSVNVLLQKVR